MPPLEVDFETLRTRIRGYPPEDEPKIELGIESEIEATSNPTAE